MKTTVLSILLLWAVIGLGCATSTFNPTGDEYRRCAQVVILGQETQKTATAIFEQAFREAGLKASQQLTSSETFRVIAEFNSLAQRGGSDLRVGAVTKETADKYRMIRCKGYCTEFLLEETVRGILWHVVFNGESPSYGLPYDK
ncbi:MAG: hypothetical protein PHQ18_00920 [Patescibacteria group bacterium]|nr:hypothetical protein [Patescibacteria group bacterium]